MTRPHGGLDADATTRVHVSNIGGIDEAIVEFGPGVTIMAGRNATNRTSFLKALMGGLGSSRRPLKADAEEGSVTLEVGDETFTRTYTRTSNGIMASGSPYLEDPAAADLFAFLLGDNRARRAVERGEDLRELILRPVDTEEIETEINRLQAERDQIDQQVAEIRDLQHVKTELVEDRDRVQARADEIRDTLDAREPPEDHIEGTLQANEQLAELLEALRDVRSDRNETEFELTTEREGIAELRTQRDELERERETLESVSTERIRSLEERIENLRNRRSRLETEINRLGTVREFNADMLEGQSDLLPEEAPTEDAQRDGAINCWTCGSAVDVAAIRTTLDQLDRLREEKTGERQAINAELEELRRKRSELERQRDRRRQLDEEIEAIRSRITEREERAEELETQRERQAERIEALEADVPSMAEENVEELIQEHREYNELEFELDRLEREIERIETDLADVNEQIQREEDLQTRRENVTKQLDELQRRVERIEREAISAFNDHMTELLELLNYRNLERVGIERRGDTSDDGDAESGGDFELHVVRTTEDGTTYRDSIDHLSESEREVIGLVFALSGYLVHELHETLPYILLDSLEVIDSERIGLLIEYFENFADNIVVALLPEDAAAIDDAVERIDAIGAPN